MEDKEKIKEEDPQKEPDQGTGLYYYIYYIVLILVGVYMQRVVETKYILLGDIGGVVPIFFMGITEIVVRWLPFTGIVGILMTTKKKELEDIYMLYMGMSVVMLMVVMVTKIKI